LLFAALMLELMLLRGTLTVENARKVLLADMIYGISAGVLLVVGLGRVFHFEKGASYYSITGPFTPSSPCSCWSGSSRSFRPASSCAGARR
jgi:putative membrane protein